DDDLGVAACVGAAGHGASREQRHRERGGERLSHATFQRACHGASHGVFHRMRYGMFTVTAPVGQRSAQGPQYQHSSTCMKALPLSGLMARESSGQISTHSVQPWMHSDSSMVTGISVRWFASAI